MMVLSKEKITILIKQKSAELGFDNCGVAKVCFLEKDQSHLDERVKKGYLLQNIETVGVHLFDSFLTFNKEKVFMCHSSNKCSNVQPFCKSQYLF